MRTQKATCHLTSLRRSASYQVPWYVPVECVRLGDRSVEPTGRPGADHLKQEHDAVPRLLGDRQVHVLSRLGGHLHHGVSYPRRQEGRVSRPRRGLGRRIRHSVWGDPYPRSHEAAGRQLCDVNCWSRPGGTRGCGSGNTNGHTNTLGVNTHQVAIRA